jgi:equilibrative nucleoside transporter 1/2/3
MIAAPSMVSIEQQGTAGTIMIWFLTFGLAAGSVFSFVVRALICSCNPFE